MTKNRTRTPVYLDSGMHPGLEVKGLKVLKFIFMHRLKVNNRLREAMNVISFCTHILMIFLWFCYLSHFVLWKFHVYAQQTQNIWITFVQCWADVEDVGPTLYKCFVFAGTGLHSHIRSPWKREWPDWWQICEYKRTWRDTDSERRTSVFRYLVRIDVNKYSTPFIRVD